MLDRFPQLPGVSTTVVVILVVLLILQVTTQVYALVDLARRDALRSGRKWMWALVIVLGSLPGAIVYLAAGRAPAEHDLGAGSGASAAGSDAARRAVDVLYNSRDRR